MKVRELIEHLEDQDPEAEVLLMTQSNWPFENSIHGVTSREEMGLEPDEADEEDVFLEEGTAANDVFIVEGRQLRYGSKSAWSAC